jgi:hypothetical protein
MWASGHARGGDGCVREKLAAYGRDAQARLRRAKLTTPLREHKRKEADFWPCLGQRRLISAR